MIRAIVATVLLCLFAWAALGRDDGQWEGQPPFIRQWFSQLMQPDNPGVSCCGEADAFEADSFEVEGDHYVAIITNGKGIIPEGTKIQIPNEKMKWDAGNPTGHGIVFLGNWNGEPLHVYCYVTPGGV